MSPSTITCAMVDERDLDIRYIAGTLSEAEAEEFEAHCFECDRCWGLVQTGLEIRAGLSGDGVLRRAGWGGRWLAAAAVAVLALGFLWQVAKHKPGKEGAVRGEGTAIQVMITTSKDSVTAQWARIPGAASYRLRLYSPDGAVLLEREVAETVLVSPRAAPDGKEVLELLALDELHRPLARSPLTPVPLPIAP